MHVDHRVRTVFELSDVDQHRPIKEMTQGIVGFLVPYTRVLGPVQLVVD